MKMSDAFPGKYLAAGNFEQPRVVTIARVTSENVSGGNDAPEHKPVVYFQGQPKGLVLNRTNFKTLADLHGDESDAWAGKKCEVYPTTTEYKGEVVPCVRIRAEKTQQLDDVNSKLQEEADAAAADGEEGAW